jgi:hypothetical protein
VQPADRAAQPANRVDGDVWCSRRAPLDLQGLLTNDVLPLEAPSAPPVYACLLNAQGRHLHDLLLFRTPGAPPPPPPPHAASSPRPLPRGFHCL